MKVLSVSANSIFTVRIHFLFFPLVNLVAPWPGGIVPCPDEEDNRTGDGDEDNATGVTVTDGENDDVKGAIRTREPK